LIWVGSAWLVLFLMTMEPKRTFSVCDKWETRLPSSRSFFSILRNAGACCASPASVEPRETNSSLGLAVWSASPRELARPGLPTAEPHVLNWVSLYPSTTHALCSPLSFSFPSSRCAFRTSILLRVLCCVVALGFAFAPASLPPPRPQAQFPRDHRVHNPAHLRASAPRVPRSYHERTPLSFSAGRLYRQSLAAFRSSKTKGIVLLPGAPEKS
jgi:hypothetical protein